MNLPHSQKSQRIAGEASPGRRFSALAWSSVAAFALFVLIAGRVAASTPPAVDSTFEQPLGSHAMHLVGPMGIGFDRRAQEIVVANTDAGRIEFFDEHGHSTGSFIHQVRGSSGDLQVGHPKHVAVDGLGRIYVVDIGSPDVDVCDFRGRNLATIALPAPDDRLETGGAGPMALAADGRLFVASRSGGRIHVFGSDRKLIQTWGVAGPDSGQLSAISGLALDPSGNVVVTCVTTALGVQIFDAHGKYLRGFGVHDIGPGRFSQPSGVAVSPDGRIWVVDCMRANLQVFDSNGALLGVVTGGVKGSSDWLYPSALASDGKGLFALAEWGGNRIRLLWMHMGQRTNEEVVPAASHVEPQSP